jgi:FAD/FMN-containing dehydrogenase
MDLQELRGLLKGFVESDPESLKTLSTDFGRLVYATPAAVVAPADADDIRRLLDWANQHGCPVAVRGSGHSQGGQSLNLQEGVLLDMTSLRRVGRPKDGTVWVDAGATWEEVLEHVMPRGWVPPVLTNNLAVTVGGTLSVGGLGAASHRYGTQADNVEELEVVTGVGDLVRCSTSENRDLFDAVRSGLGQFAVIVRAKLKLRRYSPNVRTFYLLYDDLQLLIQDCEQILHDQRFDFIEGWCAPCAQGLRTIGGIRVPFAEWFFPVHLGVEYADSAPSEHLLHGLRFYRSVYLEDSALESYFRRMEPVFELWRESGDWRLHHPWMEAILPWERAGEYISGVLRSLPPTLLGNGHVLLWPCRGTVSETPMFVHPVGEFVMAFGIRPAVSRTQLKMALSLLDKAGDLVYQIGGKRYLSGWLGFDSSRWQRHFGDRQREVRAWKRFFDPNSVLSSGFIQYNEGESE